MKQIKIIIADDHPLFIDGVKTALKDNHEIKIIGEALNGNQLLKQVNVQNPHLVLLDISMPEMNGLEVAENIKRNHKKVKVIMLTLYSNRSFIKRCQALGVEGYMLKDCGKQELLKAINIVNNGGLFYSVDRSRKFEIPPPAKIKLKNIKLSSREKEVLALMANDKNCIEIAKELGLNESTVRTYKQRLLIKSGTNTSSGLINWAYKQKLI
jgi:DNA-binding NarL/FixJ family response regulator